MNDLPPGSYTCKEAAAPISHMFLSASGAPSGEPDYLTYKTFIEISLSLTTSEL